VIALWEKRNRSTRSRLARPLKEPLKKIAVSGRFDRPGGYQPKLTPARPVTMPSFVPAPTPP
jgi:hypothetical protein